MQHAIRAQHNFPTPRTRDWRQETRGMTPHMALLLYTTANLRTKIQDFRGFVSSMISMLRGGISMPRRDLFRISLLPMLSLIMYCQVQSAMTSEVLVRPFPSLDDWRLSWARTLIFVCALFVEVLWRITETCGDWHLPPVKWPTILTSIAEICGDDDSERKVCGQISESRLVKFPSLVDWRMLAGATSTTQRAPRTTARRSLSPGRYGHRICWATASYCVYHNMLPLYGYHIIWHDVTLHRINTHHRIICDAISCHTIAYVIATHNAYKPYQFASRVMYANYDMWLVYSHSRRTPWYNNNYINPTQQVVSYHISISPTICMLW